MPNIDLSILNQRQTPAFYADVFANRPAAGYVGRIFVSTNTFAFYRDNGTGWDLIGGPGTGTITGSGASGQIALWDGASTITGDTGLTYNGTDNSLTASKFIVTGGTSSQFLKGDGSLDSNTYNTGSGAASQVAFFSGTNSISGENNLWWDSTNNHFGINTNTPGTAADIHHDQSTILQLNQTTATNDTRIAFQNSGTALWRIGNFYNAGANDWGIFDVVGAIQPVTVKKTTGQVLIGTSTVGSGKLVVASTNSDNGVQIVGASAPSLRIDNAESGPTKRAGLGISTATNNFIQGSADRDFCMFNGSTTASPILFGIYDAAAVNVQEAARISPARNFLVGTTTDAGQKLQVAGTTLFTGLSKIKQTTTNWYDGLRVFNGSSNTWTGIGNNGSAGVISSSYDNTGSYLPLSFYTSDVERVTITAAGNLEIGGTGFVSPSGADKYIGLYGGQDCSLILQDAVQLWEVYVNDDFYINRGSTTVLQLSRTTGAATFASDVRINSANALNLYNAANNDYSSIVNTGSSGTANILFAGSTGNMTLSNAGNLLIGTTTDAGQKLQVNGSALITSSLSSKDITINESGSGSLTIIRQSNGYGSVINFKTSTTTNWYIGTRGLIDNNFYFVNENLGVSNLILNSSTGAATFSSTIQTAAPSSGSAQPWKLGSYAAGGTGTATGVIYVELNGQIYSIPALLGTP